MSLLTINTCTTPPRQEKSLDTTIATAVTPRPCPTPTQIGDVHTNTIRPLELGDLLDKISYMKLNSAMTSNFCDASSISSLSVSASERDGMFEDEDEEDIFGDDREKKEVKPSLKRCSKTFCFVPKIHACPSPPAKRMRFK